MSLDRNENSEAKLLQKNDLKGTDFIAMDIKNGTGLGNQDLNLASEKKWVVANFKKTLETLDVKAEKMSQASQCLTSKFIEKVKG